MLDTVLDKLRQIEKEAEASRSAVERQRVTPLEFLQQVYHSEDVPLNVRLRAAIECAPYLHPKLSATLLIPDGGDLAQRLDRAIERARTGRVIEHEPTVPIRNHGLRRI
jgi:hypothetical protein